MSMKMTINQIAKCAIHIVCMLEIILLIIAFIGNKETLVIFSGISSCLVITVICVLSYCTKQSVKRFSEKLEHIIKDMLKGRNNISFTEESETYFSGVQSDLYKLYEVLQTHKLYETTEKKKLQELISDIAHQVKTPVFNLKTVNTILLDEMTEQHYKEFLDSSMKQVEKLEFLMQALVKTSRLELGIIELHPCKSPLYITISNAINGIIMQACKENVDIEVKCDHSIIVTHDKKWTEEAIFNILDNAVKYIANEKKISVIVDEWESYIKIEIADTGIGIRESEMAQIFKRFYRSSEVSSKKGVGIGLYLVRKIIDMQNGMIEVESYYGKGSKFNIFLPNK